MYGKLFSNNKSYLASSKPLSPIIEESITDNARIKVYVRVRPLNEKEISRGQKLIVKCLNSSSNQSLAVWDPASFEATTINDQSVDTSFWMRNFSFDRIFWSINPLDSNYACQATVFREIGEPVIEWIISGYNCCVLAYGQTGTGKTYTMSGNMKGDPDEYGLVPRICFGLFEELGNRLLDGEDIMVTFSHMEIYNENVKDLLTPPNSGYLRVREHPQNGVFVANLTTIKVQTFEDIMSLIALSDKNRTIAETNLNTYSSRSHGIVTITVSQRKRNNAKRNGLPTSALQHKVGKVHLVDLAGSERVAFSGAKGSRLKEANHINLSLSVLGDVIKCLADSKGRNGHVPYRNSNLTLVLKESLGGNSHAVMITALSPASRDYEETISTLKYADRAKRIRMRVEANITTGLLATDRSAVELVPLLQAEVHKLKQMLKAQQGHQEQLLSKHLPPTPSLPSHSPAGPSEAEIGISTEGLKALREMKERVRELEEQLAEREKLICSLEAMRPQQREASPVKASLEARERAAAAISTDPSEQTGRWLVAEGADRRRPQAPSRPVVMLAHDAVDLTSPRLINLNQDPLFSECLVYYIPAGVLTAGSSDGGAAVILSGPDIADHHGVLTNTDGCVHISPGEDAVVSVNGQQISAARRLEHFDRVAFGAFHLFRFEAPRPSSPLSLSLSAAPPDWHFAQQELLRRGGIGIGGREPSARAATALSLDRPLSQQQQQRQLLPVGLQEASAIDGTAMKTDNSSPSVPSEEWWSRLNRVAEGQETAAPHELRAMLRTIVQRAEERGGLAVGATAVNAAAAPTLATLQVTPSLLAPHIAFEREAKALQDELAVMQQTLENRMQRYQVLTSQKPPDSFR